MEIRLCQDKDEWNQYLSASARPAFLQSWEWGEFQRAVGHEPVRLRVSEGGQVAGQLQGFRHKLGLGQAYFYVPMVGNREQGTGNDVLEYIKQQGYTFIRIEPQSELRITNYELRIIPNRQPQHTLILDLNRSARQLLSAMHSKTRYNIHLAERRGVVVREEKNAAVFWRLNQKTVQRDQFRSHPRAYYAKMLELETVYQLIAEYQGQPIATNILIHFGDTLTYLHGASGQTQREAMAPYLLQWRGMELARRLGCTKYDLWGVAPQSQPSAENCFHNYCWDANHKWGGITRFKAGFGGEPVVYGQAVDVVLQPWKYRMYEYSVFSVFVFFVLL